MFYVKLEKRKILKDSPFFYSILAKSVFETLFLTSIYNFYLYYNFKGDEISYSKAIPMIVVLITFAINYFYFNNKSKYIINHISNKSNSFKNRIKWLCISLLICILILFFYSSTLIRLNNSLISMHI